MNLDYPAVGTVASPATLTAAYTGNTKSVLTKHMKTMSLKGTYTPLAGQTNRYIQILVEESEDGTNYYERSNYSNTTTDTNVYEDAEFTFPGSETSTGGAAYDFNFKIPVSSNHTKVSIREDGSANFGTIYANITLQDDE